MRGKTTACLIRPVMLFSILWLKFWSNLFVFSLAETAKNKPAVTWALWKRVFFGASKKLKLFFIFFF